MARKIKRAIRQGSMPVVVGIDPSLIGSAIAVLDNGVLKRVAGWTDVKTLAEQNRELYYHKLPTDATDVDRLNRIGGIAHWVRDTINIAKINAEKNGNSLVVAMEGYAFSRVSLAASDLHELGGLIKQWLFLHGIPFRIYPPTVIKKAFTGRGGADKADMKIAALQVYELNCLQYGKAGENIADAVMIATLLYNELQLKSGRTVDKRVEEVLRKVTKKELPIVNRPLIADNSAQDPLIIYH